MVRRVEVVPHDPAWVESFRAEAERVRAILGREVVAVHHIGSTAVPGLPAKPIVDLLVEVRDLEQVDELATHFSAAGYLARGEAGLPGHRFFIRGSEEVRSHHVHIFAAGDPQVERHLAFRDYLIAHPEEARAYGETKAALARHFPEDIHSYIDGKDAFVKEMEQRALAWRRRHAPGAQPGLSSALPTP